MGAGGRDGAGPGHRALAAIALCAALPVLIGLLLTTGQVRSAHLVARSTGHWVYVPARGVAVHVDGTTKRVDATVSIGAGPVGAGARRLVLQDRRAAYLVDDDRVIIFDRGGVIGEAPLARTTEAPVPVEARDAAYLVYRAAGLVVRLGTHPVTASADGPLGIPVVTRTGRLWTYQMDSGRLCLLTGRDSLDCPGRVPAGHTGTLAVRNGRPGFVDVTAGTWQALDERDAAPPVDLGVSLPADAAVGTAAVAGRLPVVDPARSRLLLVGEGGDVIAVPLGAGRFGHPVSTGGTVAVVDADTGTITSYDASGRRQSELTMPGGAGRPTIAADGRGYADSTDGRHSVVIDDDGTLTAVRTTGDPPPRNEPPSPAPTPSAPLPPATVAVTTTETVPPLPDTVTVAAPPTTSEPPDTNVPSTPSAPTTAPPAATDPPPNAPPERPAVDVLSAAVTGPGQATIQIRVSGTGPVFCHVYVNSVERAATRCAGTMTVVANDLAPGTTYDIYVLGTNAVGTGVPGSRAVLRT